MIEPAELVERIWQRDPTVWTGHDEASWLGWLDEPRRMRQRVPELREFGEAAREEFVFGKGLLAAEVAEIAGNRGKFDLTLVGPPVAKQLQLGGYLQPLDRSAVPNIKYIAPVFQRQFPFGIPTDYGKTGFAYRKDLIPERPTSWHDLWRLAKKYSGRTITMPTVSPRG